jgi:pyruvate/2-oxoacid:ferredoxin oxidoreductase alpha subunit
MHIYIFTNPSNPITPKPKNKKEIQMDRNYDAFRFDIAESLIEYDNAIEKTEREIKEYEEYKTTIINDPDRVKKIDDIIQQKERDLKTYIQECNDILRG